MPSLITVCLSCPQGIKGFWWSYPNIYDLVERELGVDRPFTDWTRSSFFSPAGLQVEAPVLNRERSYPSPLGLFFHTRDLFTSLPLADRASMIPLLYAVIDFERDEETYREYDKMTARELFRRFGISKRCVADGASGGRSDRLGGGGGDDAG